MPKTEKIVAITVTINGAKFFVRSLNKRADGQCIPYYTEDRNLAHDYETEMNALRNIDRILNYNNYRFEPAEIEVVAYSKSKSKIS